MDVKYGDLVSMVGEIETDSGKAEFSTIDISKIKSLKVQRNSRPPFRPLLSLAIGIESGHIITARPQSVQQAQHFLYLGRLQRCLFLS